ncbi:MFS transporter [Salarchaeum japonicum]|uniref:MFS transporter n=1 Tax=Salarchaeum japonicum TaxID=555573 RepID=A0AAV3T4B3_9EURY|nr:MFS transporter [Salarchaeum japonicum]
MGLRTELRREAAGLWDDGTGVSLVAIATGWGLLNGVRMVYPVVIPFLRTDYGLSLTLSGFLVTVLWFFAAIGQLPGGMLADRYDERALMAVSVVAVAGALALVATSSSPLVLFAATAVWGAGHSLYPIARITILSKLYTSRLGSALGVTMATGDIGQTVLPPIAVALATAVAWQAGLGFVAPLLVLAGVAVYAVTPRQTPAGGTTQSLRDTLDIVSELRTPSLGFMTLILFLYLFIWQSFTAFFPTYLTTVKGLTSLQASVLFGFFFAVGVVVKPLAGAAYDRVGIRHSLVAILLPAAAGFLLLPLLDSAWLLAGVTALVSTMLGTGAVTQSFLADAFSDEMQGTGLGVIRTLTASVAAAGPVVFGVVGDHGYFDEGYVALAAVMVVVILLTYRMPDDAT